MPEPTHRLAAFDNLSNTKLALLVPNLKDRRDLRRARGFREKVAEEGCGLQGHGGTLGAGGC